MSEKKKLDKGLHAVHEMSEGMMKPAKQEFIGSAKKLQGLSPKLKK